MKKDNTRKIAFIALFLSILIITVWFTSHFRMRLTSLKDNPKIMTQKYYDCPGVGLKTDIDHLDLYLGCRFHHEEQLIKNNPEGKGILIYWD